MSLIFFKVPCAITTISLLYINVAIIPTKKTTHIIKIKFLNPSKTGFSVPSSGTIYSSIIFLLKSGAETETTEDTETETSEKETVTSEEEETAEEKPIESAEETKEAEEIKETHYKTTTRISRKITRYILAAQKTEETEPSLFEEVIEGQESNPDFVLPEDRSIEVTLTWDVEKPAMGDIAHFSATLNGYEELETRLQWQISPDGEEWTDIEEANELTYDVMMVPQYYRHYWRIVVTIVIPEKQQEEIPEEKKEENQEEIPEEDLSEEEESEEEPEEEPVILKEIIEDTILEVIKEEIDEPEDIEVTEIVEETVEIIEVADESEVPGLETPAAAEQAEKDETASDLQVEETEEQP